MNTWCVYIVDLDYECWCVYIVDLDYECLV